MHPQKYRFLGLTFLFLSVAVGSLMDLTLACVQPPPPRPRPGLRSLGPLGPGRYIAAIGPYETFPVGGATGSAEPHYCACGVGRPATSSTGSVIQSIDLVGMVQSGTDTFIPHFVFSPNKATARGFSQIQPGDWTGFLANLGSDVVIPGGLEVDLLLIFTAQPGLSLTQVAAALVGTNFGTAGATPEGMPVTHITVVPPIVPQVAECHRVTPCQVSDPMFGGALQPGVSFSLTQPSTTHIEADIWDGPGCTGSSQTTTGDLDLQAGSNRVFLQYDPPLPSGTQLSLVWRVANCPSTSCFNFTIGSSPPQCSAGANAPVSLPVELWPVP